MKLFIDIETGGFSISKNGVCELAFAVTDNNLNVISEYSSLIKPYPREESGELVSYKPDAMAVNNICVEKLHTEGKEVTAVCTDLLNALQDHNIRTIIGHNLILFDVPRIDYLLKRFHGRTLQTMLQVDTMQMSKNRFNFDSHSLEALCDHFGITNEKAHSALSDVRATIELYKKLINV